jgi:hypothetical protein
VHEESVGLKEEVVLCAASVQYMNTDIWHGYVHEINNRPGERGGIAFAAECKFFI